MPGHFGTVPAANARRRLLRAGFSIIRIYPVGVAVMSPACSMQKVLTDTYHHEGDAWGELLQIEGDYPDVETSLLEDILKAWGKENVK